jgi:hypothetical protein
MSEDTIVYVAIPALEESPFIDYAVIGGTVLGVLALGAGVGGLMYAFEMFLL